MKMYYQRSDGERERLDASGSFRLELASGPATEAELCRWACQNFARPDKDFVDVGAHIGTWVIEFARASAHVHAFEPGKRAFNCLCANLLLADLSARVTPCSTGLSDMNGKRRFYIRGGNGAADGFTPQQSDPAEQEQCVSEVRTLDSYHLINVGFIRLDVEGHELAVLRGCVGTLRACGYPPVMITSQPDGQERRADERRRDVFALMKSLGYELHPIRGWSSQILGVKA